MEWHSNEKENNEDKVIEEDADIRKLLLEALLQLCATMKGREILRKQNTYLILRELHKVEKDETYLWTLI